MPLLLTLVVSAVTMLGTRSLVGQTRAEDVRISGSWTYVSRTDAFTDEFVRAYVYADGRFLTGYSTEEANLLFMCDEDGPQVRLVSHAVVAVSDSESRYEVRWDDNPTIREGSLGEWRTEPYGQVRLDFQQRLFVPPSDWYWLMDGIRDHSRFRIRFTGASGSPKMMDFAVDGFQGVFEKLDCFDSATIAERIRSASYEPPPYPEPSRSASLREGPTLTRFTVAPQIMNRQEVVRAMEREYPPLLRDSGIGGTVNVLFFIDEDGRVQDFRIDESSGHQALDEAALAVAAVYEFSAALDGDKKVPVRVSFPITFQVR